MRSSRVFVGFLTLLSPLVGRSVALDLSALPQCGLECTIQSLGNSTCELTDLPCICNDEGLTEVTTACVLQECAVLEALDVARFQADNCERPRRNRKVVQYYALVIELLAWVCPWIRLYSRWVTVRSFDVDDWLMLVSNVCYSVLLVGGQYIGKLAFGVDTWYVDPADLTFALKIFYICQSFYLVCLGLTKVSILYFYLRIFPQPLFQRLTYACMALVVVPSVIFLVLQIIQCRPIRLAWEFWMSPDEPYECFDLSLLAFSSASLSIAQDFVMLLLPLPWLWQLNLKLRRKLGIMLMFSLGIFVLVTSAVRLRYLVKLSSSTNPAWDYTDPILWSGIEVAVSIAVACLPSIRVLLHKVLPQLWSGITSRSNRSRSKSGYIGEGTGQSENTSKVRSAGLFGAARKQGIESESQIELGIQLGDKAKGHVRTEIYGSQLDSREGSDDGIRVDTVTTTQVVDGR